MDLLRNGQHGSSNILPLVHDRIVFPHNIGQTVISFHFISSILSFKSAVEVDAPPHPRGRSSDDDVTACMHSTTERSVLEIVDG